MSGAQPARASLCTGSTKYGRPTLQIRGGATGSRADAASPVAASAAVGSAGGPQDRRPAGEPHGSAVCGELDGEQARTTCLHGRAGSEDPLLPQQPRRADRGVPCVRQLGGGREDPQGVGGPCFPFGLTRLERKGRLGEAELTGQRLHLLGVSPSPPWTTASWLPPKGTDVNTSTTSYANRRGAPRSSKATAPRLSTGPLMVG